MSDLHKKAKQCADSNMTEPRPPEPTPKAGFEISTSVASSAEILKARSMNYWLGRISAEDIAKLWTQLQGAVRDVEPRIMSELWASGTIYDRGFRAAVTACTTGDGFVLSFTVSDTSGCAQTG